MPKNISACLSHKSDHWSTPKKLYNAFMIKGFIDPCPLHCTTDNLSLNFKDKKLFINPPYSHISKWVDFAIRQYNNNCSVVLLIPARTDTIYFHRLMECCPLVYFIKGRLHFNDEKKVAPFPSIIVELLPPVDKENGCAVGSWYAVDIDTYLDVLKSCVYDPLCDIYE